MICSKCGKEIADGSKFCGFCGASQMPAAPAAVPVAPVTPVAPAPVEPVTPVAPAPVEPVKPVAPTPVEPVIPVAPAPVEPVTPVAPTPAAPVPPAPAVPVGAAPINAAPMNGTPVFQSQASVNPTPVAPTAKKTKKKGKGGLIAGIIAALVVLVGGGLAAYFLFFADPTGKIEKALGEGNITEVVELYGNLKSDKDKEKATEMILSYTEGLEEQYVNEELEYDKVSSELNELSAILEDNKTLKKRISNIDAVNTCRDNFKTAESKKAGGSWMDYVDAIGYYEQVSADDEKYYDKAQDAIAECKEAYKTAALTEAEALANAGDYEGAIALLEQAYEVYYDDDFSAKLDEIKNAQKDALIQKVVEDAYTAINEGRYGDAKKIIKDAQEEYGYDYRFDDVLVQIPVDNTLVGTWYMEYDLSPLLAQELGDEFSGFEAPLLLNLYFDFNEDGTMKFYADPDQFKESFATWRDSFIDFAMDMIYDQFKAEGLTKKQADKLIKDQFGMTMQEYMVQLLEESMDFDELLGEMSQEAYYVLEGDQLGISEDGYNYSYDTIECDGETLKITSISQDDLTSSLAGLEYPLTLYRSYDTIE